MKRAVGLVRVSSEDQKDEGYGIPEQVDRITEYIERAGYLLVTSAGFATEGIEYMPGFFQEDYKGTTPFRPAILALQSAIAPHGIQVVVLHRTNRLGRRGSVQQVLEADFKARGVRVEYVTAQFDTDTHYGRFIRNVMGSVDELDHEQIVYQLRDGREQAARSGSIVLARPPYGYKVVKEETETGRIVRRLEIVDEEAAIVRLIFAWYAYGDEGSARLSISAISTRLTDMRVLTRWDSAPDRRGNIGGLRKRKYPPGVWDDSTVSEVLHNETYAGRWAWGKTKTVAIPGTDKVKYIPVPREQWIVVPVPPIIDEEVFKAVQERYEENTRLARRNRRYTYLFSGMLTCNACKHAYIGQRWSPTAPYRYRCGGKRGNTRYVEMACDMPNFAEVEIDGVVWPWIQEVVSNPEQVEAALNDRQTESEEQNATIFTLVQSSERLIRELKGERDRVLTLYKKGRLDEVRWEVEDRGYARQIAEAEQQKAQLLSRVIVPVYTPEYMADIKESCRYIAEGMATFNREEKREVYELLSFKGRLAIEEGERVVYAECILDARRLAVRTPGGDGNDEGRPAIPFSSTGRKGYKDGGEPLRFTIRLVIPRAA